MLTPGMFNDMIRLLTPEKEDDHGSQNDRN